MPLKILNLYAGAGGNRRLWGDEHKITAVELNPDIANLYQTLFPNDRVIVGDAMEYLLNNFRNFDFIWASPPCPSHSRVRFPIAVSASNNQEPIFPEMSLYQIIIFLKHYFKGKYVVENVVPFYEYLIKPSIVLHRHPFWVNFGVDNRDFEDDRKHRNISASSVVYGCDLRENSEIKDKRAVLRNQVNPEVGLYLFEMAQKSIDNTFLTTLKTPSLFDYSLNQ